MGYETLKSPGSVGGCLCSSSAMASSVQNLDTKREDLSPTRQGCLYPPVVPYCKR